MMNTHLIVKLLILWVLALNLAACVAGTNPEPTPTWPALVEVSHEPPLPTGQEGIVSYYQMKLEDTTLDYAVVLPDGFQAGQSYPILLAMPPGEQSREMVEVGLENYWAAEAYKRGWIVLSPLAPEGQLFFRGSEQLIPEFLARTAELYPPEGDKYYLGGVSNGGISAFRVAVLYPELFYSVLVLPGLPFSDEDFEGLARLKEIPVAMFAGQEEEQAWLKRMQATETALTELGGSVSFEIIPGDGHVTTHLNGGKRLFDLLESFRTTR